MNEEHYVNLEFYVAGVKFHQYKEICWELKEGTIVELVPEPDNVHDIKVKGLEVSDAIKVMVQGYMLGYVPARTGQATHVAKALRAGVKLWAVITKTDPSAEKDHRKLKIWIREKETTSDEVEE